MNKVINHVPQILFEDLKSAENEKYWDKVEKSHILITGGTGFIAYYLIMTLLCMNDVKNCANTITILVRNEEKARQKFGSLLDRPDFRVLKQDVCLPVVDSVRYDYIIHAASSADAKHFESEPIGVFNANVLGTQNMLALAKEHSCKSMVYISSFTVYGAANDVAKISEDYCGVEPWNNIRSCYSYGKRSSEFLCFAAHRTEDVPVRIVRPGFVYGASAPDDPRVYAEIIRCLAKHQEIVLQSAGHLYRSMIYVTDLVRGILNVLFKGIAGEAYNLAGEHISIRQFAQAAADNGCLTMKFLHPEDEAVLPPQMICGEMDITKAAIECDWSPTIPAVKGIGMAAEVFKAFYGV